MNDIIDRLLEHLWLNDRLSHNTLEGYRRDLQKIAGRLQNADKDWFSAEAVDLADAVYVPAESSRSQARALSALKRLYGWLLDTHQIADNPTARLKTPKQSRTLPDIITEKQIDTLLNAPDTEAPHGLRDKALLDKLVP